MQITIRDETSREVLEAALWRRLRQAGTGKGVSGEGFEDETWGPYDLLLVGASDDAAVEVIDARLSALQAVRADIETVRTASVGATVGLETVWPSALRDDLRGIMQGIEEADDVWRKPEQRGRIIAGYEAAQTLADELSEPAVMAVA